MSEGTVYLVVVYDRKDDCIETVAGAYACKQDAEDRVDQLRSLAKKMTPPRKNTVDLLQVAYYSCKES